MAQSRRVLMTLGSLLLLAGCAEPLDMDYRDAYAVRVQPETVSWEARFAGTSDPFGGTETAGFDRLVAGYLDRGHGPLVVSAHAPAAHADARTLARLQEARERLIAAGLAASSIRLQVADGGAPEALTLSYTRYNALVPICGNWPTQGSFNYNNQLHANFGCALQHNVAVMAADPAELAGLLPVQAPTDTENSNRVLNKYRAGAATAAIQSQLQTSGALGIVGVGK